MTLSRRDLFRAGAAVGGVVAVGGVLHPSGSAATASEGLATLSQTLLPGDPQPSGYRPVVVGPGENHILRTDLGVTPDDGRATRRRAVVAFAQMSDVHVVDTESPLRVEYFDRLDDPSPIPGSGLFTSAYRAQEMLSGQIADAMVREINDVGRGPVTGKPLALAIQTGDNSDNAQFNEVRWNIDVLGGGEVRVDSGDQTRFEAVFDDDPTYYDPAYWHPHGTPDGGSDDVYRSDYGFPTVPGLLDAARRPFRSAGLDMPWLTAFGNHDGLIQGNFPPSMELGLIATGNLKLMSLPAGMSPSDLVNSLLSGDLLGVIQSLALTPAVRQVTADPDRRLLGRKEWVDQHFTTPGSPTGHGLTADNQQAGTAYYYVDRGLVRFIALDTVNPNGYYNGSLDQEQFAWLKRVLEDSASRVCVVYSHHSSWSMDNAFVATGGDTSPRVLGAEVLDLLLSYPEVVAWVNGHTHKNHVRAHTRPGGGGLWEINTASHIDWPQQSRILEIADNRDGTLSIFTTMVDHAGQPSYGGKTDTTLRLASLARELALNDPHHRDGSGRGGEQDRNVELVVADPT